MRLELKSLGIWSFFKVFFFLNLVVGFIFGIFYAIFAGLILTFMSNMPIMNMSEFDSNEFSFGFFIIVMPIIMSISFAVINTILGVIVIGMYNLIAKVVGGFEMEFSNITPGYLSATNQSSQASFVQKGQPANQHQTVQPPQSDISNQTPPASNRQSDDGTDKPDSAI